MTNQKLSEYKGNFAMVVLDEHPDEAKEYFVEEANEAAVILREKGKSKSELYLAGRVVSFYDVPPKPAAPLKARRAAPLELSKAKRHLVDFHGYKLTDINRLSDQEALDFHETIDHKELDMGHYHGVSKAEEEVAKTQADAVPAAEEVATASA